MPSVEGVRISELPQATTVDESDVLAGVQYGTTKRFSMSRILEWIKEHIGLTAGDVGAVDANDVGVPGGVAALDANGKVPTSELDLSGVQAEITASGILKGDGQGGVSAAVAGTDYATPVQLAEKANQSQLAHVQASNVADHTYKVGEPFCYAGYLFRTTMPVSIGTTLVNGQNCERVTVGAGLVSTRDVTATTNAQGRLSTGLQTANAIVLAAFANSYFCSVYVNNNIQGIEVRDLSGAVVASTSVTVTLVVLYV